jgi:hypothetical protein
MDDSIYSLGFISQINDEIMNLNFDLVKGQFRGPARGKFEEEKEESPLVVNHSTTWFGTEEVEAGDAFT